MRYRLGLLLCLPGLLAISAGGFAGCGSGTPADPCEGVTCDDDNECTDDACNEADGTCESTPVPDDTACDFEGFPGVCASGVCEDAMLCGGVDCDDDNECTDDACDRADGSCDNTPKEDRTPCNAGVCWSGACTQPIEYTWTGTFKEVSGPFDHLEFTISFVVGDPSSPLTPDMFFANYRVDARLDMETIGVLDKQVGVNFGIPGTTVGLGSWENVLMQGDSLSFGICTGGACNDPILWNRNGREPVLFTGEFPLGLDSSCYADPPCNNAIANYFDGMGGSITTPYEGHLSAEFVQ